MDTSPVMFSMSRVDSGEQVGLVRIDEDVDYDYYVSEGALMVWNLNGYAGAYDLPSAEELWRIRGEDGGSTHLLDGALLTVSSTNSGDATVELFR